MGNSARQDALLATDKEKKAKNSSDDHNFEAWVAYYKAKKSMVK